MRSGCVGCTETPARIGSGEARLSAGLRNAFLLYGKVIVERVKAGFARAKAQGKHCGRPFVDGATEQAIRAALATGKGRGAADQGHHAPARAARHRRHHQGCRLRAVTRRRQRASKKVDRGCRRPAEVAGA